MPDPFPHLHVASGYSLQYGASHPHTLVERAVEHGMDTLALTDRDGTYGAVKFAKACLSAGIRPVLGVDLAHRPVLGPPGPGRPAPAARAPRCAAAPSARSALPRATFLANGRAGWAALCRLVSATHLAGERGRPVLDLDLLAEQLAGPLGAGDVRGAARAGVRAGRGGDPAPRRPGAAALAPWRELVPTTHLVVELVSHRLAGGGADGWGPGTTPHAARMAGVARQAGLGTVLTNAVRYAERHDAPTVDVLDAARRLVALGSADLRRVGPGGVRGNAEGFLKSGKEMAEVAEEIARMSGRRRPARRGAAAAGPHPRGGRPVRARPARRPRAGRGALPGVRALRRRGCGAPVRDAPGARPTGCCAPAARARSATATARPRGSGSGSGSTTSWRRSAALGYASYFLTVGDVTDLIREMGVRCAARGSGAGSLVNYLLGISGVDPIRHGLLMERFLSPLRQALPDIDVDVESARRLEVYERILDRYTGERCVTVSMMDSYRVRHAVRDVGAALGMPPGEIDAIAKAFPHIRARDARNALRELPELRGLGAWGSTGLDLMFRLVERLDGLPRHIAVHPCGVLLSDATLLDRTPVEASYAGFPMSQFDKDDVEDLGLLKLDVLGIRMQSSMAHALTEIKRVDGVDVDLEDRTQVPFEDETTYRMISSAKTLGVFQIESPGQRELVGKSGLESFEDIITDISLFRPGPVKSDMITPYLEAKQGWRAPVYLHEDLRPILGPTHGVVVFHEQVIEMIARFARISYAEADEKRRALGDVEGMAETRAWFFPRALGHGYPLAGGRAGLEGARGVRVVRLLQGARGGVRAADLPVRLAQGALAGALPLRRAHPRPGHVPQAADPRRRPPARHRDPRPRRQRLREGVRRGAPRATAGTASGWRWPRSRGSARPRSSGSSPRGPTTR